MSLTYVKLKKNNRTLDTVRWEAETVGRLLGTALSRCCASTALTSKAAA